uniref:Glutaredoxin domain-containing protein n=1 Tax=Kalanchoe fedtschenkoi TaxID=63787 RepID=A0A7N0VJZ6_KALFE
MACVMEIQSILSSFSKARASSVILRAKAAVALPVAGHRVLFRPYSHFAGRRVLTIGDKRAIGFQSIGIPSMRCYSAITPELKTTLDKVVSSHKVILFMKGTKDFPQCGFSNTVVQILKSLNVPFETVNILENEALRQGLKDYSNWPTFPQLYIDGEFYGGCDITVDAYKSGQLQEALEKAMCS